MTETTETTGAEVTAAALADGFADGRFEACGEHRGADADAPCADCGWLAVDHTAGLAEVIVVGRGTAVEPLRRAS